MCIGYISKSLQRFPDPDLLQRKIDIYMANFTKAEEREFSDARSMAGQVDADGFTLVGSAVKRKGGPLRPEPSGTLSGSGAVNTEDQSSSSKKNKRSKEKKDFYRFQIREQKKQEMNGLLKRFREDQEKIKELKEKKRFRPY